jgi:hypothetical protein
MNSIFSISLFFLLVKVYKYFSIFVLSNVEADIYQ